MALLTSYRRQPSGLSLVIGLLLLVPFQYGAVPGITSEKTSSADIASEYRLKAGFLLNFPQFVDWPTGAFGNEKSAVIIGVLGDDPFGGYIDELVAGERVGGRPLVIRRFRSVREVATCHILFISRSNGDATAEVIAEMRTKSVLTVGENDSFERQGGMVRFFIENNRVRLRINNEAARNAGLVISSKLLRLAAPSQSRSN